ncbi:CD44 antigen isoform X3 [Tachysurus vachellii]|uniref:CD44 antigen isoform X3 n=1 Tax=Tachysurus vachellii TaxID=175792 RepID=UPI00296A9F63|nr:CD44 antigen isoform X3 [Tachysurus vachellii]
MWFLLLGLISGLLASSWGSTEKEVKLRSCSYVGVFHIQGKDRYTLTFDNAKETCEALGTTLASLEQVTAAHDKGLESCRYGWISNGNVTIPRHVPNPQCANNQMGVISLVPTDNGYDAYCYDQTDQSDKNCTLEIKYLESDPESVTEDSVTQDMDNTNLTTDFPTTEAPETVDTTSDIITVTDTPPALEETNQNPNSSHEDDNVLDEVLNQTTQFPLMTPEPEQQDKISDETTTAITSLDSGGSGMGDATLSTTTETTSEEIYAYFTKSIPVASTEDEPEKPVSVNEGGRKAPDMAETPEEKASTNNWLVVLLVVVAIAAIILVCVLVVTRNRWCGKRKTLMITSKSSSEGNGTAASVASPQAQEREQEMVTLMNKEKIQENGNTEEFTVITLEESPEKNEQA